VRLARAARFPNQFLAPASILTSDVRCGARSKFIVAAVVRIWPAPTRWQEYLAMRGRRIIQRGGPAPHATEPATRPAVAETGRTVIARAAFFYAGGARPLLGFALRRRSSA
jgi:hypothetical protein